MCDPRREQRDRQIRAVKNAVKEYIEQGARLRKFKNAMSRRSWLPTGPMGRLLDHPVAKHHPRDEGPLSPTPPSCHSLMVAVNRDGEEA